MSKFFLDLVNPLIAPTPAREARVGIVVFVIAVALVIWRVDQLWLQILIPAAVAILYGVRIAISASRAKKRRAAQGTERAVR
ncbi:hypothetical protein [Microbacterium lacticum]|uniref:hypothetical protein n=1 Tax=Microbacterium lacticum TaxID=33885 RepID=UPI0018B068FD|nr:hypothetical protein [Microbacterium lacticum]MBF9337018.1 hypothetical protein [Microbacterium lacticum]